eukprot:4208505-Prymnesium_polylepis.1
MPLPGPGMFCAMFRKLLHPLGQGRLHVCGKGGNEGMEYMVCTVPHIREGVCQTRGGRSHIREGGCQIRMWSTWEVLAARPSLPKDGAGTARPARRRHVTCTRACACTC